MLSPLFTIGKVGVNVTTRRLTRVQIRCSSSRAVISSDSSRALAQQAEAEKDVAIPFPKELDIDEDELKQMLRESVQNKTPEELLTTKYDMTPLSDAKLEEINNNALLMNRLLSLPMKPSLVKKFEKASITDREVDVNVFFATRQKTDVNFVKYIQGLAQRQMFDYALEIIKYFRGDSPDGTRIPGPLAKSPHKMIVTELKLELARRQLSTAGKKPELLERLVAVTKEEETLRVALQSRESIKPGLQAYTSLVSALAKNELSFEEEQEKIDIVTQMVEEDKLEIDVAFVGAIMAVKVSKPTVTTESLDSAFALMKIIEEKRLKPNPEVFSALIKGCVRNGDPVRAWQTFEHMRVWHCDPDFVVFNQMMFVCSLTGEAEKALNLFQEMKDSDIFPTDVTFNCLLNAFTKRGDLYKDAFNVLGQMRDMGYKPDKYTYKHLMETCGRTGDWKTSGLLFDELRALDTWDEVKNESWPYAFMLNSYSQGLRLLYSSPDLEAHIKEAESVVNKMLDAGVPMSNGVMDGMLSIYARPGRINRALAWWDRYKEFGLEHGKMAHQNMILLFSRTRRLERAFDYYNKMKLLELRPDVSTYSNLVAGCTNMGFWMSGMRLLRDMKKNGYEVKPHFQFVVNLRRNMTSSPHLIRELDDITGKSTHFVPGWKKEGGRKKRVEWRDVSKAESKNIANEPVWLTANDLRGDGTIE